MFLRMAERASRRLPSEFFKVRTSSTIHVGVTNPDEITLPRKPTLAQGWGFAIAKTKEFAVSPE
jgi:hypothetical protein